MTKFEMDNRVKVNAAVMENPPHWFGRELPHNVITTRDIEIRVCGSEVTSREDTPINILEVYLW